MSSSVREQPILADVMGHLIRDTASIELFSWVSPAARGAGMDALEPPADQLCVVQNYFAEYHLEYFRQRQFEGFPSRLHAQRLFATHTDAENYSKQHPESVKGKMLARARSTGAYVVSFHDSSWLDYLRLPHNLSLETLNKISSHYWLGELAEEINLRYLDERWREPPVIEALFMGTLEPIMT